MAYQRRGRMLGRRRELNPQPLRRYVPKRQPESTPRNRIARSIELRRGSLHTRLSPPSPMLIYRAVGRGVMGTRSPPCLAWKPADLLIPQICGMLLPQRMPYFATRREPRRHGKPKKTCRYIAILLDVIFRDILSLDFHFDKYRTALVTPRRLRYL
jgi:hypothetical protein